MRFPLLPTRLRWLGVAALVVMLIYFSLLTVPPPAPPDEGLAAFWDKQLHFAGYLALGLALAYATVTASYSPRRRAFLVLAASIIFGVAIEVLQGPLPNRYFSYADMVANAVGAILAAGWFLIEPRLEYVPVLDRSGRIQ